MNVPRGYSIPVNVFIKVPRSLLENSNRFIIRSIVDEFGPEGTNPSACWLRLQMQYRAKLGCSLRVCEAQHVVNAALGTSLDRF
jgi:hypothetical protein